MTSAPIPPSAATKAADSHTAAADVQAAGAAVLRMIQGLHISRAVYVAAKLGIGLRSRGPWAASSDAEGS